MARSPSKRSVYFQGPRLNLIAKEFKTTKLVNESDLDNLQKVAAEKMRVIVLTHIKNQDLRWKKLSEEYIQFKKRNDLYEGHWIETGELAKKLKVHKSAEGQWYVGGKENEKHMGSGLLVNHMIQIHEFGILNRGLPARPLFRPSAKEFREFVEKDSLKSLERIMTDNWKKMTKRMEKFKIK